MNLRSGSNEVYSVNNTTNRYNSIGGANLSYDTAGRLTGDHRGYSYEYDYENRLVKITEDETDIATFAYDALGRRIRKIDEVASQTTLYYHNENWQVLSEYDDSDVLQRWYIYGNYIDEVLMMVADSTEYYYAHDHLYSPVALMNNTGTVLERYEYDAYGKATIFNAAFTQTYATTQYGNRYLFTGRWVDNIDMPSFPLQHNRHRDYDCDTGRWLTHDPLGITPNVTKTNPFKPKSQYTDGMNLYQYVGSSPIMSNDILGLSPPIPGQPGWAKQCGECGPDITSLMQNMRGATVRWFYMDNAGSKYGNNPPQNDDDRKSLCEGMCTLSGWDIWQLKWGWENEMVKPQFKNCATGDCPNTVRVGNGCYSKDEVNYYVFGVMASICEQYFPNDESKSLSRYHSLVRIYLYPYASWRYGWKAGNNVNCKYDWFMAGYNGSPVGVNCGNRTPACKLGGCTGCFQYFFVNWKYRRLRQKYSSAIKYHNML